jgi:hypothetical protein
MTWWALTSSFSTSFGQIGSVNYALSGVATQSSTSYNGPAQNAIDGNTDGNFADGSVAQTAGNDSPAWWQVDLGSMRAIGSVSVWFRTDCCPDQADNFTLLINDGSSNVVWQRLYAGQPSANVTYTLSAPIQGRVVRVESSGNPGGLLSLAEVQVFAAVSNALITLTNNLPSFVNVEANHSTTLGPIGAQVQNADPAQLAYQWMSNGVDIAGTIDPYYITPILKSSGSTAPTAYSCRVLLPGLSITSSVETVTVVADQTAPFLTAVTFASLARTDSSSTPTLAVGVQFDESMDLSSLANPANYSFAGATIASAIPNPDGQSVTLQIRGIAPPQTDYSMVISNVRDLAGNPMLTTTNYGTIPFYALDYALTGAATQSSSAPGGGPQLAIDGNTDGNFSEGSVTLNAAPENPGWWEVDLGATSPIGQVQLWFRTDCCNGQPGVAGAARDDNFTLKVLDSSRSVLWTTTYPGTPPTNVFYNFDTALQGRYVRFESQTPLNTSDGYFSLAEVQVIAPYTNVWAYEKLANAGVPPGAIPTVIGQVNHQVLIGPGSPTVANAPSSQLTFQWQRNGVDIPGATAASYATPPLVAADNGAVYQCRLILPGNSFFAVPWTLSVIADQTPPQLLSVAFDEHGATGPLKVTVSFDETLGSSGLLDPANYRFSGGTVVGAIALNADGRSVSFYVTPNAASNGAYSLAIGSISDINGNQSTAIPVVHGFLPFAMTNLALAGAASQSSIGFGAGPQLAIDGNTDGYFYDNSVTHNSPPEKGGWWEVNLGAQKYIGRIHVWFRTDCCTNRQDNFVLKVLDASRAVVWQERYPGHPPTDVGFNLAPAVAGQYVRFEAPVPEIDQGAFSLAEVQVFPPYKTNLFSPPLLPKLYASLQPGSLLLSWRGIGTLQTAQSVQGSWSPITGAGSPFQVALSPLNQAFYRVVSTNIPNPNGTNAVLAPGIQFLTLDSFNPPEAWPDKTVTAHFTLYVNLGAPEIAKAHNGFVSGYVTRNDKSDCVLYSDFYGVAVQNLGGAGRNSFAGTLTLKNWITLYLAPFLQPTDYLLPFPIFNVNNSPNAILQLNPFQQPAGPFNLVLEYWEQSTNGEATYDGVNYTLAAQDSLPIGLYPPCDASQFSDFIRILDFSALGKLFLENSGLRTAPWNQFIDYVWTVLHGGYPPFGSHPGSISSLTLSNFYLNYNGGHTISYATLPGPVQRGVQTIHYNPSEPADHLDSWLTVSGNCGTVSASVTPPTVILAPPPPPPPPAPPLSITFYATPTDPPGQDPAKDQDAYINVGQPAVLHWKVVNCQTCKIGLVGIDDDTRGTVLNLKPNLSSSGTLSVSPVHWTHYTLNVSGSNGSGSPKCQVAVYHPQGLSGAFFWFKVSGPNFCGAILEYAANGQQSDAQSFLENEYGPDYTVSAKTEAEAMSPNLCN